MTTIQIKTLLLLLVILTGANMASVLHASASESIPILAEDPGPPPPQFQSISPTLLISSVAFSTAVVLFGLAANVQGKISRKQLIACTGIMIVITWSSLLFALSHTPESPEFRSWKQAHQRWKDKVVVDDIADEIVDPRREP